MSDYTKFLSLELILNWAYKISLIKNIYPYTIYDAVFKANSHSLISHSLFFKLSLLTSTRKSSLTKNCFKLLHKLIIVFHKLLYVYT